ncbi:MAG: NAD(P)-binding domain-containing protein [Chloroflexota bacterium]|nr:NAD(P)-binding domain-containing protein [Chloroflexota bacterium]
MTENTLPVAVIGAGPIGLAAAAHLIAKGETPIVFESGESVGANIRRWEHVHLFSPWCELVDSASRTLLEAVGWPAPDPDTLPTGRELLEAYLEPLAALPAIAEHVLFRTRVVAVTRQGMDKMKDPGREESPFVVHFETDGGTAGLIRAKAVIDASGTYVSPNPLGASGIPAVGERMLADRISYGIPNVLTTDRQRYAGRRVLVVGSGHSAFNALLDLATLKAEEPNTAILWAIRSTDLGRLYGGQADDALPARGLLGTRLHALVESGTVQMVTGYKVAGLRAVSDGIVVTSEAGEQLPVVDEIIATTGFRPDLSFLRELRLGLDPSLESPIALAPLIDPNVHSCGTVYPHGAAELAHPERDFYMVGIKSYGRAPTFLLLTGYEQVRSVVCAITGDLEGAAAVELELPETGVCSSGIAEGAGCSIGTAVDDTLIPPESVELAGVGSMSCGC